jgi:hypothetical protein
MCKLNVGWLTYLSGSRPIPHTLPAAASVDRMGDGTMIVLAEDPEQTSEAVALAVRDALAGAGGLGPVLAS